MSIANTPAPIPIAALAMAEHELMEVLRNSLYPGAKDASIKLVISWCKAQNKDPLKRPVHIVPMSVKSGRKDAAGEDIYEWRDVLMPGIGDYRTDAARTGQYAGISEAKWGPDKTETLGDIEITYPEWCEISVYRLVGGQRCEFSSGRVWWKETYATRSKKTAAPNSMWLKRPRGQLEKCTEGLALRRAFPEVGAQPTAEEMEGRQLEDPLDHIGEEKPALQRPAAKHAAAEIITAQVISEAPKSPAPPAEQTSTKRAVASAGALRTIRSRLQHLGITEQQVLDEFRLESLDGISVDQHIAISDWLNERKSS